MSSSKKIQRLGNSKQVSPARKWLYTWNNYPENLDELRDKLNSCSNHGFGKEKASTGTPHLQGWVEFHEKVRPCSIIKFTDKIRWEKMNGTIEQNIAYCSKEGDYYTNYHPLKARPLFQISPEQFRLHQIEWYNIFKLEPEPRGILYWWWEPNGNIGKSAFVNHLIDFHAKEVVFFDGGDYKDLMMTIVDTDMSLVKAIVWDMPRASRGKISTRACECIFNGRVRSMKYEGGFKRFAPVHIMVFSNDEPYDQEAEISADRWRIKKIE